MCRGLPSQQQPADHRRSSHRVIWSHFVIYYVCGEWSTDSASHVADSLMWFFLICPPGGTLNFSIIARLWSGFSKYSGHKCVKFIAMFCFRQQRLV